MADNFICVVFVLIDSSVVGLSSFMTGIMSLNLTFSKLIGTVGGSCSAFCLATNILSILTVSSNLSFSIVTAFDCISIIICGSVFLARNLWMGLQLSETILKI